MPRMSTPMTLAQSLPDLLLSVVMHTASVHANLVGLLSF